MIVISGIGWITGQECGCAIRKIKLDFLDLKSLYLWLVEQDPSRYTAKNFNRFDQASQMVFCAVALALHDAGKASIENRLADIGIVGTNSTGSLSSNLNYFRDYIEAGRILARGNLFIYTLPSSPLAEAAIHFGWQGPLLYLGSQPMDLPLLLDYAKKIILRHECSGLMAVKADEKEAVCLLMRRGNDISANNDYTIEEAPTNDYTIDEAITVIESAAVSYPFLGKATQPG